MRKRQPIVVCHIKTAPQDSGHINNHKQHTHSPLFNIIHIRYAVLSVSFGPRCNFLAAYAIAEHHHTSAHETRIDKYNTPSALSLVSAAHCPRLSQRTLLVSTYHQSPGAEERVWHPAAQPGTSRDPCWRTDYQLESRPSKMDGSRSQAMPPRHRRVTAQVRDDRGGFSDDRGGPRWYLNRCVRSLRASW